VNEIGKLNDRLVEKQPAFDERLKKAKDLATGEEGEEL